MGLIFFLSRSYSFWRCKFARHFLNIGRMKAPPSLHLTFWGGRHLLDNYWPYFHCTYAEMAILELPVKNFTSPFALVTSISYNRGITLLSVFIFSMFWWYLVHVCRNGVNSASGLKLPSLSGSVTTISYTGSKIVAIWQHNKHVLRYFHCACSETAI